MGTQKKYRALASRILLFAICICSVLSVAQNTFPACDGRLYYFAENPTHLTLTYVDQYSTSNVTSTVVCNLSTNISTKANALGANPVDNYLYFIEKDDVSGDVVIRRLRSNCNAPIVCPANNNPTIPFAKAACFDTLGRYWVLDGTQLCAWDLNTCKIVKGPYVLPNASNDIVFNPWACCLYTGGNKVDLDGNVTTVSGSSLNGPGLAMGMDGKIYSIQGGSADSMELTRYDLVTGTKSTVGYIKPGSVNGSDMASIPCAVINANFIASPPGCTPTTINFTDKSTGLITNWNWDFGDGTTSTLQHPSHTYTSPGTYNVKLTVSVTNSCIVVQPNSFSTPITIVSNPIVTVPGATICPGNPATLTAGGASTYTWAPVTGLSSTTGSSVTANPPSTTTYTITGTSAAGCTASTTATVTVNNSCTVNVTTTSTTICNGQCASVTATGSLGTPPYTFLWNTGATTTAINACPVNTTSYTVTLTDNTGLTASAIASISINPLPVVSVPNTNICTGGSATLTATGASTYTWNPGTGLSSTTGTSVTANPATTSTYTVTGTSTAGCTGSTTVVVTVGALIANGGPDVTICPGGSTTLTVTGGSTFTWTPATGLNNPNIANPVASPLVTTTYTVNVSDGSCSDNDIVIVNVSSAVTLNAAGVDVSCNGACNGQLVVIPSGGTTPYTYSWNSGCSSAGCSNICAGSYNVTVTDASGCTATAPVVITEPPPLTVTLTGKNDVSCFGLCDGTAGVSANGGTAAYTYSWNSAPAQTSANATNLCTGNYTCTVTDIKNCTVNTSVIITQPTPVVVTSTGVGICPNTCTTLNANGSGGTGSINYAWNLGVSTAAVSVCPTATTSYTVIGTDANGCTAGTSVVVTIQLTPTINVPGASICQGTNTTLTATGATTYSWLPLTGLSSGTGSIVTAGPNTTTTYTVTGTNTFGCTNTTTVVVTVNISPSITPNPASVCPGDSVALTASGADTYIWSPALGLNSTTGSIVIVKPSATSFYTITGTGTNGCTSSTLVTVTVHPNPVAAFSSSPDPVTIFNPTVYFQDGSTGAVSWNWKLGDADNTITTERNPIFTYPDTGKYIIQLIVSNQYGCIDTVASDIRIKGGYTFFIPNTFTPNGDGKNDGFSPKGTGIDETDYDLWIFDRWGNMIWHTDTWGEEWSGRANYGEDIAQIDTYVWKVHVREKDTHLDHNYIGHVNIVK